MRKLAVGVFAAALTIAACNGSGDTSGSAADRATTTTAQNNIGGEPAVPGADGDLAKVAAQYAKAKIKISYTSSNSGEGTTLTIAQDGNGKSAFSTGNGTYYTDGKTTVACEGSGATAKCTDLSGVAGGAGAANIGAAYTATFALFATALSTLPGGTKSSETIAGREASCVKYKASDVIGKLASSPLFKDSTNPDDYDATDTSTICIDKETGFVLKFGGTKKGSAEDVLVATAVGEPNDADFTPPVTPQTLPGIPNLTPPND